MPTEDTTLGGGIVETDSGGLRITKEPCELLSKGTDQRAVRITRPLRTPCELRERLSSLANDDYQWYNMRMGCVYRATNRTNEMSYIGFTTQRLVDRKRTHKNRMNQGKNALFYQALREFGWSNFKWDILFVDRDESVLAAKEKELIAEYDTMTPNGYNEQEGGLGRQWTEAQKKKIFGSDSKN